MRNAILILLVAYVPCVMAQGPVRLKRGEYLRAEYLERLKVLRSTFLAGKMDGDGGTLSARIEVKGNAQWLSLGDNFHDVDMDRIIDQQGNALRVDDPTYDPIRLKVLSENEFEIIEPKSRFAKFRFVDSIEKTACSYTIAGKFLDSSGVHYEFTSDGKAKLPNRTLHYEIGLDHLMDRCDYIMFKGESWAFRWEKGKHLMFKFTNEDMPEPLPHPFLILTPVTR